MSLIQNMKTVYQHYSRTITNGNYAEISVHGRFLTLLTNSSDADIKVQIANQSEQRFPAGISIELPPEVDFVNLKFWNRTGATVTITFAVSSGKIYDSRLTISDRISTWAGGSLFDSPVPITVDDTKTKKISADTDALEVMIQNLHATYNLWIGDSNIDPAASRGFRLAAGNSIVINTSADIYLACESGETLTASYIRVKKV